MSTARRLLIPIRGQAQVEYALLLTLIAVVASLALLGLGGQIPGVFAQVDSALGGQQCKGQNCGGKPGNPDPGPPDAPKPGNPNPGQPKPKGLDPGHLLQAGVASNQSAHDHHVGSHALKLSGSV